MNALTRVSLSAMLLLAILGQTPAVASSAMLPTESPTTIHTVNSTLDQIDLVLDGVCLTSSGVCTLRAAVMEANFSGGGDVISLPAGIYTLTLSGANEDGALTGDLDITKPVLIGGAGANQTIIDGNSLDRVFDVFTTGVQMEDISIQHSGLVGLAGVRLQSGAGLTISEATIANNQGSGIQNNTATLTLNRVTVSGNTTAGLYSFGGAVNINNSTFSNNSGANGGGIYIEAGSLSLNNATIANNFAIAGGGIYRTGSATVVMANSIVAGNTANTGPDCNGILALVTYSLVQNASGCTIGTGFSNLLGVDPLIGALQNNGGPSFTHALAITSPALNVGDPAGCKDSQNNPFTIDQRGTTRPQPQGGRCDMGAYEVPVVQLASANFSANEGVGSAVITATIDGVSALTLTVPYTATNGTALAGSDYVTTTGTLTFPPNTLAMMFTVPLLDDPLDEADETVALTLGNPSGALLDTPVTATLTILDNDLPPDYYLNQEDFGVDENAGPAVITANLNAASGLTVTVNYSTTNGTALAGSDYLNAAGTLTFAPGITTATFMVPIINEMSYEADETVLLNLGNANNALPGVPTVATLTIFNDDPPQLFLPFIGRNFFNCWPGPNEVEPNGSIAQAHGPLCYDGRPYTGGDSTPLNTIDWDYYTLQWPLAGQFTVRLTGTALGPGLQLQMYYQTISSGTLVGYLGGPNDGQAYQITCPPGNGDCTGAAGLYYILVYMPAGYNGSGYTLTVTTP